MGLVMSSEAALAKAIGAVLGPVFCLHDLGSSLYTAWFASSLMSLAERDYEFSFSFKGVLHEQKAFSCTQQHH